MTPYGGKWADQEKGYVFYDVPDRCASLSGSYNLREHQHHHGTAFHTHEGGKHRHRHHSDPPGEWRAWVPPSPKHHSPRPERT
jgi:hypothetical protein